MKRYIIYILVLMFSCSFAMASDFEKKVKEREDSIMWEPLKKYEGSLSLIETLIVMAKNFHIIDDVRKRNMYHPKLRYILDKFDFMCKDKSKDTFIKMYNYLNKQIPEGRNNKGSIDILEVLDHGGNCNDVSPLFYSLFGYYGFDIYVMVGKGTHSSKNFLHSWIAVLIDNEFIELDPLWYGPYFQIYRLGADIDSVMDIKNKYKRYR